MSGNTAKEKQQAAQDIERHIELVQPRSDVLEESSRIKEKIKVRATSRKAMAMQQLKSGTGKKRESKLVPAEGGMGMVVE